MPVFLSPVFVSAPALPRIRSSQCLFWPALMSRWPVGHAEPSQGNMTNAFRMSARWVNMCSEILDTGKYTHKRRLTHGRANPALNLFIYLSLSLPLPPAALCLHHLPHFENKTADLNEQRVCEEDERSVGRQSFKRGNGRLSIMWSLLGPAAAASGPTET